LISEKVFERILEELIAKKYKIGQKYEFYKLHIELSLILLNSNIFPVLISEKESDCYGNMIFD
jgi:hypothetical protein